MHVQEITVIQTATILKIASLKISKQKLIT